VEKRLVVALAGPTGGELARRRLACSRMKQAANRPNEPRVLAEREAAVAALSRNE